MRWLGAVNEKMIQSFWDRVKRARANRATYEQFKLGLLRSHMIAKYSHGLGRVQVREDWIEVHALFWSPSMWSESGKQEVIDSLIEITSAVPKRPIKARVPPDRKGLIRYMKSLGFIEVKRDESIVELMWIRR